MGRERGAGRPKGPMSAYACFVQVIREEHKKKHPEEQINFAEFSKKCAEKWKTMTPKEKKRFEDMSLRDKERHEREMALFAANNPEQGGGGGGGMGGGKKRKRKMIKDKDAPKRALSAFFWFCEEHRASVRAEHPEWRVGDMAKELSRRWEVCLNKPTYEAKASADKQRYEAEMQNYRATHNGGTASPARRPRTSRPPTAQQAGGSLGTNDAQMQQQPNMQNQALAAAATLAGMQQQGHNQQQQIQMLAAVAGQAGASGMRPAIVSTGPGGQTVIMQTAGVAGTQAVQLAPGMTSVQLAPGQQLIATPTGLQVQQVQPGTGIPVNMIQVQGLSGMQAQQVSQFGLQGPLIQTQHLQLQAQQNSSGSGGGSGGEDGDDLGEDEDGDPDGVGDGDDGDGD